MLTERHMDEIDAATAIKVWLDRIRTSRAPNEPVSLEQFDLVRRDNGQVVSGRVVCLWGSTGKLLAQAAVVRDDANFSVATGVEMPGREDGRIDEWTPVSTFPAMRKEYGDWRAKSRRVLGITRSGRQQVVFASQEESDPEEPANPVKWTTGCSESWDVTGEILYWRDLPSADALPGVTLDPDFL